MSVKVSVVIPVYNAERYLEECITSLLNQTLKECEFIFVNDGSTDKSLDILNRFAQRDSRIKIIIQNNQGVSVARNKGLENSNGEWILFIDGDDILHIDITKYIQENGLDMIVGGFRYKYENDRIITVNNEEGYKNGIDLVENYGRWILKAKIGSFIIKREVLLKNKIVFNINTKYGEDVEFINYCLINSIKVKVVDQYFCDYVIHNSSAIGQVNFRRYDCYESRNRTLQYVQEKFPDYENIKNLYKDYLLPESLIDTTYFLCREGISIYKIMNFIKEKGYYTLLIESVDNHNIPPEMKRKIVNLLKSPTRVWLQSRLSVYYYELRSRLGILKGKLLI